MRFLSRERSTWRVIILVAAVVAVAFGALGLSQYQANEVVECEVPAASGAGTQKFFSNVGDEVGSGCQYAQRQAHGLQRARWFWYAGGSVIFLALALMPLAMRPEPARPRTADGAPAATATP